MTMSDSRMGVVSLRLGVLGLVLAAVGLPPLFLGDDDVSGAERGGAGPAAVGQLETFGRVDGNLTSGIDVTDDGTVLYADRGQIRAVTAAGSRYVYYDGGIGGPHIRDLSVGRTGEVVFSADDGVVRRHYDGAAVPILGHTPATRLDTPRGVVALADGGVLVAKCWQTASCCWRRTGRSGRWAARSRAQMT